MTGPTDGAAPAGRYRFHTSPGFADWLAEVDASLAFAVPPEKFVLVGRDPQGGLAIHERTFPKTMGLATDGPGRIWLGCRNLLWRFDDAGPGEAQAAEGVDRVYVPRRAFATGYLNTHDVTAVGGEVTFVATRFCCLARPTETTSFEPVWSPPWFDGVVDFGPGDRCHLNGLCADDAGLAYATSVSTSTGLETWRDHRSGGGVIVHVPTREVVATGFSMPHSPRMHEGRLYVCNSGDGHLCSVDPATGRWERIGFVPGFLRGLSFVGRYAVGGVSKPREGDLYSGLGLDDELERRGMKPRHGLFVIDLDTGMPVHWLFVEGPTRELYDVTVLPGVRRPIAFGTKRSDVRVVRHPDLDGLARRPDGRWAVPA
jgi:uncharacterized protein (TIGR03032 family)